MNDEKKEIELECPPIEYETKKAPTEEKISDKDFFKLAAWPVYKLVEFIDKSNKK